MCLLILFLTESNGKPINQSKIITSQRRRSSSFLYINHNLGQHTNSRSNYSDVADIQLFRQDNTTIQKKLHSFDFVFMLKKTMEFFQEGLYQFTFAWTIENIALSPEKPKDGISSPTFVIHALGDTKWCLVLLPRGLSDPEYMSLFLCRQPEGCGIKQVMVNYRFSIETNTASLQSLRVDTDILFEEGDYWGYSKYLRRDQLNKVLAGSSSNCLTLRCDIGVVKGKLINYDWNETVDYRMLSNNLMTLYKNENLADVALCCDGREIKVHKCVLAVRLPKLLSQLRLLKNGQLVSYCNIFNMSLPVLKSLLFYAYSGKLDIAQSEVTLEFLEAAYKYELPDVIQKLESYPRYCSARTTYSVEQKSIGWIIQKSNLRETNPVHLVRIVPTDAVYVNNITVSCCVQTDLKREYIEHVLMTFQISGLDEKYPVFVSCKIYMSSHTGKLFGFCATDHLFRNGRKWTVPVKTNKGSFGDIVELRCEMEMCDGNISNTIRDSWISSHEGVPYLNDYSELSTAMAGLFSKKYYTDFAIITKGQTFAVHSAILSARSPVFCKMLEHDMLEKKRGEVFISDISSAIMQLMLLYMYSGTVRDLEYQEAIDLYKAADKYCILVLKERCGCILVSKLSSRNVAQLYNLADMRFDNIMIKRILECCESEPEMYKQLLEYKEDV